MNTTNNTILITGGGSGIGRGLAEAFHALGNQVIIAGRSQKKLDETTGANPGMKSLTVDMTDGDSIQAFSAQLTQDYPKLNVVINNAGVMAPETLLDQKPGVPDVEAVITTNLLGPIRLTAALLPSLLEQPHSTIVNVSSGLAFVPLAMTPTYCATKAALHSYTESLRYQLKATSVEVLELVPPYVQTELMGEQQASDPRAMPLDAFLAEVMSLFAADPTPSEICVKTVHPLRFAADGGQDKYSQVFNGLNDAMSAH
ncbi:MAG: SDR family oxidoreductase [Capsulimonas sp.]|uniref:SDR family oxidoreductase n=1 Tax=Capsulimonas sp. TaxID=2494211 RepID=UPI003263D529